MAYAKAEHFSNYVLVGVELPEEQAGEFDYLSLLLGLAGVSVVIGLLYFLVKTIQKWRRRRREKRKKR